MDFPHYVNSRAIRKPPNERYLQQKQAEVDALWENWTQTSFNVLKQKELGSDIFEPCEVSVDLAIDIGTGFKKSDDFKVLSHRKIDTKHDLGMLYQFSDNYWITINDGDIASPTSTIEVRRCNNSLKWMDKIGDGTVLVEPCAIEYEISSPFPQKDKDVIVANGHAVIICQNNEHTATIEKNDRFIFNSQPFKVAAINNVLLDDYSHINGLMYIDAYLDMIEDDDNLELGIANYFEVHEPEPDPPLPEEIKIDPSFSEIRQNEQRTFEVYLTRGGAKQPDVVNITTSGASKNVTLSYVDTNTFSLTCNMPSGQPLILTLESGGVTTIKEIKLKSYF